MEPAHGQRLRRYLLRCAMQDQGDLQRRRGIAMAGRTFNDTIEEHAARFCISQRALQRRVRGIAEAVEGHWGESVGDLTGTW